MSIDLRFAALNLSVLISLFCSTSHAAIVFNNFGPGDSFLGGGFLLQGPSVGSIGDVNQAAAFTVGPTGAYLTGIDIGVTAGGPGPSTGPIDIILAADAAGLPGAALQNMIVNVAMTGQQVASAGYPGTLLLAPNTTYWVVADAEGSFDGSFGWNGIGDNGPTAGQSEGFPWNLHTPGLRFAIRVEGRLVPEPVSSTLLVSGVAGIALCVRRRSGR